jgi:ubiquinone/menaquinone biosynthesis C-methylase UbiE
MAVDDSKSDIQAFWGSLYTSLYDDVDARLTRDVLLGAIDDLKDMFRLRRHMAAVEMPLEELRGKTVLEIGPGAGGHSALFAVHGAVVTSIDLTRPRAQATQKKFDLLGDKAAGCRAMQGDAENLPFADNSFDIVYSNGVLHHTRDTERSIDEVFRVVKPGGRAVIMLYCKSSWHYWINMLLCVGVLKGKAFGDPNWLGKATEWGGKDAQEIANPITRCYTKAGIHRLFHRFSDVRARKGEFYFYLIPKLGRIYRRFQIKHYGTHPGGLLVYGEPWPHQSKLEVWLGRVMGWAWFISATKPEAK